MKLFHPEHRNRSRRNQKIYAYTELAYTIVDFLAALLFVIGSILFFKEETVILGTWLFLIGSILFGVRPSIRLGREIAYLRDEDYEDVLK